MEKTSVGVSKIKEWKGNSVWYRVNCACGVGEHDTIIDFSFYKKFGFVEVLFYKNIEWASYHRVGHWWKKWWLRTKAATQIIFKGYIELESDFIIETPEHLDAFINALEEGKGKMEQFIAEQKESK